MIHVTEPEDFAGIWDDEDWDTVGNSLPLETTIDAVLIPDAAFETVAVEKLDDGGYATCVLLGDPFAPGGYSWRVSAFVGEPMVILDFPIIDNVPGPMGDCASRVLRSCLSDDAPGSKWNPPMYRTRYVEQPQVVAHGKCLTPKNYETLSIQDQLFYNGFASDLDNDFRARWEEERGASPDDGDGGKGYWILRDEDGPLAA